MRQRDAVVPLSDGELRGSYLEPKENGTLVLFAHGSGSSRKSSRNVFVADRLAEAGFGTLLMDLLTEKEDQAYENRFEIPLLAQRLLAAVEWSRRERPVPVAFFGASTGAAAALTASTKCDALAVVSRGGRPDLAGESLPRVRCPTLLIVGGLDLEVAVMNRESLAAMPESTVKEMTIVPGATHLFPEPGALEKVADLARAWFERFASVDKRLL